MTHAIEQLPHLEAPLKESGRKCAVLDTIVENCRRLELDVRADLTDALTRLPGMQAGEAPALTPAAWHAARA